MRHDNRIVGVVETELSHVSFMRGVAIKTQQATLPSLSDCLPRRFARRVGRRSERFHFSANESHDNFSERSWHFRQINRLETIPVGL